MLVVIAILLFLILLALLYGRTRVRYWVGNLFKGLLVLVAAGLMVLIAIFVQDQWGEPTALPWREVIAKPEFQQLSTQEQQGAQLGYFEDVVASRLPAKYHEEAWHQFTSTYPYSSIGMFDDLIPEAARHQFTSLKEARRKRETSIANLSDEELKYLYTKSKAAPTLWLNPSEKSVLWRERGLLWNTMKYWWEDADQKARINVIFWPLVGLALVISAVERRDKIGAFFKWLKGWLSHHTPE